MKADVAIVIVSYNSEDHIGACLESVFAQRKSVNQQVIVVDNDSRDGTVEFIRVHFPAVHLVLPGTNLGFAAGVNLGVKHADAEFVLLLNPDTVILDHAVDEVVAFARANPNHGLYGGRTLRPDGSLEPSSCWGLPTLWSMTLFAFGLTTLAPRSRWLDPESLGTWQRDTVREVGVITGCFLLSPLAASAPLTAPALVLLTRVRMLVCGRYSAMSKMRFAPRVTLPPTFSGAAPDWPRRAR